MNSSLSAACAYLQQPSMVDYPGRLAAVFFVSGCNFRCGFCHNHHLLSSRPGLAWDRLREACRAFRDNWANAAVVTGGEPTLHDDLIPLLAYFRALGWAVKLDTNGSLPDRLRAVLPHVDYVAMDVKCSAERYPEVTGFKDTDRLSESMTLLRESGRPYELRTTVVESIHSDQEMLRVGEWIRGARRYVLQAFVPRDDLPDPALRSTPRTPSTRLEELRALLKDYADQIIV